MPPTQHALDRPRAPQVAKLRTKAKSMMRDMRDETRVRTRRASRGHYPTPSSCTHACPPNVFLLLLYMAESQGAAHASCQRKQSQPRCAVHIAHSAAPKQVPSFDRTPRAHTLARVCARSVRTYGGSLPFADLNLLLPWRASPCS